MHLIENHKAITPTGTVGVFSQHAIHSVIELLFHLTGHS